MQILLHHKIINLMKEQTEQERTNRVMVPCKWYGRPKSAPNEVFSRFLPHILCKN